MFSPQSGCLFECDVTLPNVGMKFGIGDRSKEMTPVLIPVSRENTSVIP